MMRQSSDATSPFYAILEYPNDQPDGLPQPVIRVWYRTGFGLNAIQANKYYPTTYPEYMRVVRAGNTFAAGLSQDNVHWQILPGSQQNIVMPWSLQDGLATDSSITGTTGTATYNFANTVIGAVTPLPPVPSATPCPAAWNCQDVGAPSPVGDQALNGTTWTLQGTGPDIWNTFDQFHFVSQPMPADGTISAHVITQQNTSANAKAGLMLRQTLDWGSPYYGIFVTPGKGIAVQWRQTRNLRTQVVTIPGATPSYLQITRYTDPATSITYYSAFTSPDGMNWSVVLGSSMALPFSGTLPGRDGRRCQRTTRRQHGDDGRRQRHEQLSAAAHDLPARVDLHRHRQRHGARRPAGAERPVDDVGGWQRHLERLRSLSLRLPDAPG